MARRILHPTDFSAASRPAFKKAMELAKASRAKLTIVHVLSPVMPVPGDGYVSPKVYDQLIAQSRAWAKKQLAKRVVSAKAAGVRSKGRVMEGIAHEQIVRAARRTDLVVMGTHGRSGLARFFLGSVAGRVVAAAPRPVLTVRGK